MLNRHKAQIFSFQETIQLPRRLLVVLAIAVVGVGVVVAADHEKPGISTLVKLLDTSWFEAATFCPEEPVRVLFEVSNDGEEAVHLSRCSRDAEKGRLTIRDKNSQIVWDSDRADQRLDEEHFEQYGIGRLFAGGGNVCSLKQLDPGASAFWLAMWSQAGEEGEPVAVGDYVIDVEYRWLLDGEDKRPIPAKRLAFSISAAGCEGD